MMEINLELLQHTREKPWTSITQILWKQDYNLYLKWLTIIILPFTAEGSIQITEYQGSSCSAINHAFKKAATYENI